MALYDQLPVYKVSYDLLLQLYQIYGRMHRDYKFTLGEKIKNESTELIINIYTANTREAKTETLEKARKNIEVIRLLLHIYKDLKQISIQDFIAVPQKVESCSKQINAWYAQQMKTNPPL
ncbi:four helix bundle protein [Chryseobacterium sp. NRRL B-14798]|uniref:four helix bundle protein n=1 Tax=Chryseobacterium sp. NRRL B-14798 TaxID=3162880 RepID=UPI003D1F991C